MSDVQFYDAWKALPLGTKFTTPYAPGKVFMKTARHRGLGVICLTDGRPNRLPNVVNPLAGFDHAVGVIDFPALASKVEDIDPTADVGDITGVLKCL